MIANGIPTRKYNDHIDNRALDTNINALLSILLKLLQIPMNNKIQTTATMIKRLRNTCKEYSGPTFMRTCDDAMKYKNRSKTDPKTPYPQKAIPGLVFPFIKSFILSF